MKTSVVLIGGLGNRLFQIAAGLVAQQLRGGELEFYDVRTLKRWTRADFLTESPDGDQPGHFLGIPYVYELDSVRRTLWKIRRQPRRLARSIRQRRDGAIHMSQLSGFAAMPVDFASSTEQDIDLFGYFQHPSWFEPVLPAITDKMWSAIGPIAREFQNMKATAISLRLGDYVRFGAELDLEYYRRALRALGPVDGPIWIVSQEPTAGEILAPLLREFGLSAEQPPVSSGTALVRDLALLAVADNVIMSNSTFCWWGVVTGEMQRGGSERRVFVPDRWLPDSPGSEALIRSSWIPVEAPFAREIGEQQR